MFNLTKLWDRWLSEGELAERPSRDGDYVARQEPPISGEAWETEAGPTTGSSGTPNGDVLPDASLWTPGLLTV